MRGVDRKKTSSREKNTKRKRKEWCAMKIIDASERGEGNSERKTRESSYRPVTEDRSSHAVREGSRLKRSGEIKKNSTGESMAKRTERGRSD